MVWTQLSHSRDHTLLVWILDESFAVWPELLTIWQISAGFLSFDLALLDRAPAFLLAILFVSRQQLDRCSDTFVETARALGLVCFEKLQQIVTPRRRGVVGLRGFCLWDLHHKMSCITS